MPAKHKTSHAPEQPQNGGAVGAALTEHATAIKALGKHLEFHPLANRFPLMVGAEFEALVADIKANGLCEPITIFEDKILDGRNRYRACLEAGIEPEFEQFKGDEAAATAFVISMNIYRRHLSATRRRDLLVEFVKASPEKSDRQLAKEAGTTHPTIAKARKHAEATGKALPVEKRTGSDGKVRKSGNGRGAPKDGHTSEVKRLVAPVGAVEPVSTESERREDISPNSTGELQRLQSEVDELHDRLRQQTIQVTGLESEIEELKVTPLAPEALARFSAVQLADALESRLHRYGINGADAPLRKIRDRIEQGKPQIDLEAVPAAGAA
jgi:ParB-like chromosome segregation protein Spo0J